MQPTDKQADNYICAAVIAAVMVGIATAVVQGDIGTGFVAFLMMLVMGIVVACIIIIA